MAEQQNAARRQDEPRLLTGVADQRLQEARHHHEAAEVHDAEHEQHQVAAREVEVLEQMHVDDRVRVEPLPHDHRDQADDGDDREHDDEVRREPVVLLPLVERHLQRADAEREQPEPDVVELHAAARESFEIRRILEHVKDEEQRQRADGHVDEKDPTPRIVVGDPTAERRTNERREHGGDTVERKRDAACFGRKGVGENRLRHRLESAARRALQHAKEQEQHSGSARCRRGTSSR